MIWYIWVRTSCSLQMFWEEKTPGFEQTNIVRQMVAQTEWLRIFFFSPLLVITSSLISLSSDSPHVTPTRSNIFDHIFKHLCLMISSFICSHSHDDVIGKITLSKDAIGSQAKGTTERICISLSDGWAYDRSLEVKHTWRPLSESKVWVIEGRSFF